MVCQTDVWIDTPLKSHSIQKLGTFRKIHTWGDAHKPQSQNPSPKPKPWPSLQTNDDTMKPNWPHNKPKQSINVGGCMIEPKNAFLKSFLKGISPEQNSIGISGSTTIEKSFYTKTQHFCIEWSWKEHLGHLFLCILQNPRNGSSIELEENMCAIFCLFLKTIM